MNIEWRFQDSASGGAVTAFFGRCRVTQYPNGGMVATLPAKPTKEEQAARNEMFARHAKTGKIWMDAP